MTQYGHEHRHENEHEEERQRGAALGIAALGDRRSDVLIVGAGPTGLVLACDLARRGVRALVVERSPELFPGSRGKGIQPRTLEVFHDLGILEEIMRWGGHAPIGMTWQEAPARASTGCSTTPSRPRTRPIPGPGSCPSGAPSGSCSTGSASWAVTWCSAPS